MTAPALGLDLRQDVDVYTSQTPLSHARKRQFQIGSHAVQATRPASAISANLWSTVHKWPMSHGTLAAGFQPPNRPGADWLSDALQALKEMDDEIAEDGLPEIALSVKKEANRIIGALARHPWAPTVYPTQDAEIAIHFKSPDAPDSLVILLNSHGRGECYAYTGGRSQSTHVVSSDLPDGFVWKQLRAMTRERMARPAVPEVLGASAITLLASSPGRSVGAKRPTDRDLLRSRMPSPHIGPREKLGRSVFSVKKRRRARQGKIDMDIFLGREDDESISVDRLEHAPIHESAARSRERGQNRTPPKSFQGWAVLMVRHAAASGRTVEATPTPENPCHADIFLNIIGDGRRRRQKEHANEMAAHATWMDTEPLPDSSAEPVRDSR